MAEAKQTVPTTDQVKALREAVQAMQEEMPSEERCAAAADALKSVFPAAFTGAWWNKVPNAV